MIGSQGQKVPPNLLRSVVYHAWIWSASGEGVGEWGWGWEEEVRLSLEVPPKQLQQSAAGTHPAEREREQWQQYVCQHICQQYTTHIYQSGNGELSKVGRMKTDYLESGCCENPMQKLSECVCVSKKKQWRWHMSFWKVTWNTFLNRTGDRGSVIAIVWAPAWQ